MKNIRTKTTVITFIVFCLAAGAALNAAPLPGAIFTTDSTCTDVNQNIYPNKKAVYLDGGPSHPGSAGLPDGSYYVQVTTPEGTVLGKSLTPVVTVSGGDFVACYQLNAILKKASSGFTRQGYDTTTNPGGVYKVWVSTSATFENNDSKTDNFQIKMTKGGGCPMGVICVDKFYDANANGVQDNDEELITGWQFHIVSDWIDLLRYTPQCVMVQEGDYHVIESTPIEDNWVATTPTDVEFTLARNEYKSVTFGNLCLGAGGGLTKGFWGNKNGLALVTDSDFQMLTDLHLRNEDGSDRDFASDLETNKTELDGWLQGANAVNMSYMLSAQLTAMKLNVLHGFVSGGALVQAIGCGNTGVDNNFITIDDLIAASEAALAADPDGQALSGDDNRALQECLKDALDAGNNNLNFVQAEPCPFSFEE